MIEFTERTIGVWYCELDGSQDYLCSVWRTEEGGLVCKYRFRYYVDDKSFDSDDKKNWYEMELKKSDFAAEQHLIANMRMVVDLLGKSSGGETYELMMDDGGIDAFIERFKDMPFASTKEISKDEYDKDYK